MPVEVGPKTNETKLNETKREKPEIKIVKMSGDDFSSSDKSKTDTTSMVVTADMIKNARRLAPKSVDHAGVMNSTNVSDVWTKIYRMAGYADKSEDDKKSLRYGVYAYAARNGTSDKGGWTGNVTLSSGIKLNAGDVEVKIGKLDKRRFMRGNIEESFFFEKFVDDLGDDPVVAKKCMDLGFRPSLAYAMCDWMDQTDKLSTEESLAQVASKRYGLVRSKFAQAGVTPGAFEDAISGESLTSGDYNGSGRSEKPQGKTIGWS